MPASENSSMARKNAIAGLVRARPARSLMFSHQHAVAPHRQNAGEGAERHGDIDRHIDQHTLHAFLRTGGKADQREAHVANGRIGHQALDVLLADGGEGAERHRGDRDEHHDLLPLMRNAGKRHDGGAHEDGDAGHFRRGGKEGRHRRRRALIHVGRPHVERHGGNLEAEADEQKHQPEHQGRWSRHWRLPWRCRQKPTVPVKP